MSKRYFEFTDGSSSKFWEVWKDGGQVYTRYGKIGSNGQVTVKDEKTAAGADKLHDKLVKEKTGKGYVEQRSSGATPTAETKAAPSPAPPQPPAKPAAPAPAPKAAPPAAPAGDGTRRFEFVEGGSSKFWEVTIDGSSHSVRYGKVGTAGQEKTKAFGNAPAAQMDAAKLIAEKTKKGYAEVALAGESGPPVPELDAKEMARHFAAIEKDPQSPDAYLVFADWLEGQGHPWGKLISLHHGMATGNSTKRAELAREESTLLQSQGGAILGDLARAGRPTRFSWHYGFIREAVIASPTDKLVLKERTRTLFGLPAARWLKKLTLHAQPARFTPHSDWDTSTEDIVDAFDGVMPVLAEAPSSLTALCFGDPPPTSAAAYVRAPSLAKLSRAMPRLVSLEVQGNSGPSEAFDLPELRTLELRSADTKDSDLEAIAKSKLPKLERLSVWIGGSTYCTLDDVHEPDYDSDDEDNRYPASYPATDLERMEVHDINSSVTPAGIKKLLDAKWPASLKHLGINSAPLTPDLVSAICDAKIIEQLETLDLSGASLRAEAAAALLKKKDKLEHLAEVSLERLGNGQGAPLTALKNVKVGKPQRDEALAPEFIFRYVATME